MEILITNDDGWGTRGIISLVEALQPLGHITVVAPERVRSGMGAAVTIGGRLYINDLGKALDGYDVDVYTTNGTPADCVKLGTQVIFPRRGIKPDLIASGINHGSNASINAIYSGTMGACVAAAEHDYKGIGFSLCDYDMEADFTHFCKYIPLITNELLNRPWYHGLHYNVNAPSGEIDGYAYTRQAAGHWDESMIAGRDEAGREFHTVQGEFVNHEPDATDTDLWALEHKTISITPNTIDRTEHNSWRKIQK